jgi:hypothetical protein
MRTPLHLSAAPKIPTTSAPQLGEHSLPILRDLLGFAPDQIETWSNEGVIEVWRG